LALNCAAIAIAIALCPPHGLAQSAIIDSSWQSWSAALPCRGLPALPSTGMLQGTHLPSFSIRQRLESIAPASRNPSLACQANSKCEFPASAKLRSSQRADFLIARTYALLFCGSVVFVAVPRNDVKPLTLGGLRYLIRKIC
jgi:hypothetical protein